MKAVEIASRAVVQEDQMTIDLRADRVLTTGPGMARRMVLRALRVRMTIEGLTIDPIYGVQ